MIEDRELLWLLTGLAGTLALATAAGQTLRLSVGGDTIANVNAMSRLVAGISRPQTTCNASSNRVA